MIGLGFKNTSAFVRSFREDTRGSMTVFGLFFFLFSGILGAIALDITSLYAERTHLQVAADQAAHAALFNLAIVGLDDTDAKDLAIEIVNATLPRAKYGVTIEADDIEFGEYNFSTRLFTPDPDGVGAVRVTTAFTNARRNAASAYLFRLIGFRSFEIYTSSTFAAVSDIDCFTEGFVAGGVIDMQNQNFFGAGLCIHSNSWVEIQPNNGFEFLDEENKVTVSMPGGLGSVVLPGMNDIAPPDASEYETQADYDEAYDAYIAELEAITDQITPNDGSYEGGLTSALEDNPEINLGLFPRVDNMIAQYQGLDIVYSRVEGDAIDWPDYIIPETANLADASYEEVRDYLVTEGLIETITGLDEIDGSTLERGKIYSVGCNSNGNSGRVGTLEITNSINEVTTDATYGEVIPVSEVVIVTDCNVSFAEGTIVENARIITTSVSDRSFSASNGLQIGGYDGTCESDEDAAQLITQGGMSFAANFSAYGSQLIAKSDITFAATPTRPNDFVGISMIAGGMIDMASHVNARVGCTRGNGDNELEILYITGVG
jgi:hypothetical protein